LAWARARDSKIGVAVVVSSTLFEVGFLFGEPLFGASIENSGDTVMYAIGGPILLIGMAMF